MSMQGLKTLACTQVLHVVEKMTETYTSENYKKLAEAEQIPEEDSLYLLDCLDAFKRLTEITHKIIIDGDDVLNIGVCCNFEKRFWIDIATRTVRDLFMTLKCNLTDEEKETYVKAFDLVISNIKTLDGILGATLSDYSGTAIFSLMFEDNYPESFGYFIKRLQKESEEIKKRYFGNTYNADIALKSASSIRCEFMNAATHAINATGFSAYVMKKHNDKEFRERMDKNYPYLLAELNEILDKADESYKGFDELKADKDIKN